MSCEKPRKALSLQQVLLGPSIQSPSEAGKELTVPQAHLFTDRGKCGPRGVQDLQSSQMPRVWSATEELPQESPLALVPLLQQ